MNYIKVLKNINRILIVKLSSIGDVVHSLPTVKALRDTYKNAYIAWIVEEKSKDVVIGCKYLDEVIIFEKERWKRRLFKDIPFIESIKEIKNFSKLLRSKKFDLAIDLQGLLRSGLITYFSNAKYRVGYKNARELSHLFYNIKVDPLNKNSHAVDSYLNVIKYLGAKPEKIEFPIWIPEEDEKWAKELLSELGVKDDDILIGMNPGASIPHKRWNKEKFAELADKLQTEDRFKVILFGAEFDKKLVNEIINMMNTSPIDVAGKTSTLKKLAALIKHCKVFVSNDTGPLHIAVALGVPTVALFGPDNPYRTGPYGNNNVIIYKKLPCSPCIRTPTCKDYDCMKLITVEEVKEAVLNFI